MFTTRGLFGSSQCPSGTSCGRFHCSFAHASSGPSTLKRPSLAQQTSEKPTKAVRTGLVPKSPAVTNGSISNGSASNVKLKATVQASSSSSYVSNANNNSSAVPSGPPKLVIEKSSRQPRPDREKALGKLFQQYTKLYALILPRAPALAHESALKQELETSSSSSSRLAYNSAIHHALVNIHKRVVPTSLDHPSVGTVKESKALQDAAEKRAAGRLSRDRITRYLMTDFEKWRYPDPTGKNLDRQEASCDPNLEGHVQTCSRCKLDYTIRADVADSFGECIYHYGRLAPQREEGQRKWLYSCCGKERGREGCEEGVHVFSESDDDILLHRREGFMSVKEMAERSSGKVHGWLDVVGIDCEMIHTTAGISLGRVTVLDESGAIVLDELVRQKNPIIDLNTRFSGITPGQLESAVMDLAAVREAACFFIGPDTIIIGHGLENDLSAMRLLHGKVIDTVEVFPHDKGPPFRRALRDLVKEKLGYFIQTRTADLGHDSAADARATLELMAWRVTKDGQTGR